MRKTFIPFLIANLFVLGSLIGTAFLTSQQPQLPSYEIPAVQDTANLEQPGPSNLLGPMRSTVAVLSARETVKGAGVIIKFRAGEEILILTAYHVIRSDVGHVVPVALMIGGIVIPTDIVKTNEDWDLAILRSRIVAPVNGPETKLAPLSPQRGDNIWFIGHPNGNVGNISHGILANILQAEKGLRYYRLDALAYFGNSGGGVFNREGDLVGILVAVETRATFSIPRHLVPGGTLSVSLMNLSAFVSLD